MIVLSIFTVACLVIFLWVWAETHGYSDDVDPFDDEGGDDYYG